MVWSDTATSPTSPRAHQRAYDDESRSACWLLLERPAWFDKAACRGSDVSIFFPERGEDTGPAKAICSQCPVRVTCLEHAMERRELGIRGGLSERERRKIRKARRAQEAA